MGGGEGALMRLVMPLYSSTTVFNTHRTVFCVKNNNCLHLHTHTKAYKGAIVLHNKTYL